MPQPAPVNRELNLVSSAFSLAVLNSIHDGGMFSGTRWDEKCAVEVSICISEADFFLGIIIGLLGRCSSEFELCSQFSTLNRAGDGFTVSRSFEGQTLAGFFNFKMYVWVLVPNVS